MANVLGLDEASKVRNDRALTAWKNEYIPSHYCVQKCKSAS